MAAASACRKSATLDPAARARAMRSLESRLGPSLSARVKRCLADGGSTGDSTGPGGTGNSLGKTLASSMAAPGVGEGGEEGEEGPGPEDES